MQHDFRKAMHGSGTRGLDGFEVSSVCLWTACDCGHKVLFPSEDLG